MPTFLDSTRPKARKSHRCDLCFGTIEVREQHAACHMADDGRAYTFRSHFGCTGLIQAARDHGWGDLDDGWTATDFGELVSELAQDPRLFLRLLDGAWFDALSLVQQADVIEMVLNCAPEMAA